MVSAKIMGEIVEQLKRDGLDETTIEDEILGGMDKMWQYKLRVRNRILARERAAQKRVLVDG